MDIYKTKPSKNQIWRFMGSYKDRLNHNFLRLINLAKKKADSFKAYRVWFKNIRDSKYLKFLY